MPALRKGGKIVDNKPPGRSHKGQVMCTNFQNKSVEEDWGALK
jgi:hypothetical protein